jgi:hypothetical protein
MGADIDMESNTFTTPVMSASLFTLGDLANYGRLSSGFPVSPKLTPLGRR